MKAPHKWTLRTRVLLLMILLSALGMVVAGLAVISLHVARNFDLAEDNLSHEVEEFSALAKSIDPATGKPFSSVERILEYSIQRTVPSEDETFVAFVGDEPRWYSAGGDYDLVTSPELAEIVNSIPANATQVDHTEFKFNETTVLVAVVPISVTGEAISGKYVVAYSMERSMDDSASLMRTYLIVATLTVVLVGLLGWALVSRLTEPLETLIEATEKTSGRDFTQRVEVRGSDDISQLANNFNTMVGRLEKSFADQRQFLDDAGHELRTPLTIFQGHLELMDDTDPTDVSDTKALLLDETERMGRLVEDLILLAKTGNTDFIRPTNIDLGAFTEDLYEKSLGLGNQNWIIEAKGEGIFFADYQRLTQAMLQLAQNATKYTAPGERIAIGSSITRYEVQFWVWDDGPGVAKEDRKRIFERFGRAKHSNGMEGRGVAGSGLGLAIVSAICAGHGGKVEVGDGPGKGAKFTITIPRVTTGQIVSSREEEIASDSDS